MGHHRGWLTLLVTAITAAVFGAVVLVTGFLACGVAGCGGAGFGPAFDPVAAQVGLLLAGVALVPLALRLLSGRRRAYLVAGAAGAFAVGSVLAMVVLGLGPNGCPWEHSRVTAGSDAVSPGTSTCVPG
jgi:hypothetical protein